MQEEDPFSVLRGIRQLAEGFMTGSILGKKDPLLKESIDKIRGIIESDSKRSSDLSQKFDTIIELIKSS